MLREALAYDQAVNAGRLLTCALLAACLGGGCAVRSSTSFASPRRTFDTRVTLRQRPVVVHMSSDATRRPDELVLYLTGDAGWRGKDKDVYTRLQQWGYAVAGVSAPDYLKSLPGEAGTTTPSRLADDFVHITDVARHALALPGDLPVVLVGVSRGADLAVVAAGQSGLQPSLGGVVAIGLTREEEYVHRRRRATEALELYQYLPQLGSIPLSVIQSTGDNYVPAREARQLFGADTPRRRLHAIEARNHSFSNARPKLYETLRASLVWLDRLGHRTTPVPVQ